MKSIPCTSNVYIAIIDDDSSIRVSMSGLLRADHFQPVAYLSVEAFLTDTNRPKFACLVFDIHLNGMSGLDLSKGLRAVKDTTPFVFTTAPDNPEMRTQAAATDCADYFRKTTPGAKVLAAIRRAIQVRE